MLRYLLIVALILSLTGAVYAKVLKTDKDWACFYCQDYTEFLYGEDVRFPKEYTYLSYKGNKVYYIKNDFIKNGKRYKYTCKVKLTYDGAYMLDYKLGR